MHSKGLTVLLLATTCLLQVGVLFTFLARQMARQRNDIFVNRALFKQVVESLCLCDTPSDVDLEHEERQQALLELYTADGLDHFNEDRLIKLATSAAFYRVCEVVYERRREWAEIVSCYWRDPARCHLTFGYVQSLVTNKSLSTEEVEQLRTAVIEAVPELVNIDARRTAKLLLVTLDVSAERVIEHLDTDESVFHFLSALFEFVVSTPEVQSSLEPSVYERYVDVMCRLGRPPSQVVDFLRSTSGYRLAEMLDICQRYSVSDGVVCLLEKSGDIRGAFDIVFDHVTHLVSTATETDSDDDVEVKLENSVQDIIGLLHRGSRQLQQTELETVWFMLLDFLMDTMKLAKTKSAADARLSWTGSDVIKSVTRQVINAMMAHVALPAVLQRIVANEGGVAGHFGDVRDLLTGVLDACSYERTLLSTCARLVNQDLHCAVASLTCASRRASALHSDTCVVCGRVAVGASVTVSRHSDDVICFHCGHLSHHACLVTSRDTTERRWKCPVCCRSSSVPVDRPGGRSPATSPAHGRAAAVSSHLDAVHIDSVDRLRSVSKSPSRLTVLAELAQLEHTRASSGVGQPRCMGLVHSSILHNEEFALRLAAPRPSTD